MLDQDKIIHFLRIVGPTLPSKVAKNINNEILIASAYLSDLAAQGKVKISNLKVGGSPLYYLPGQESQLYHFAAGNLNPKDFQALEQLRQKKVLRESTLDLLSKVALRSLHDFAIPLHVTVSGNRELFWKWHTLSEEETNNLIKSVLFASAPLQEEPKMPEQKPAEQQQSLPQVFEEQISTPSPLQTPVLIPIQQEENKTAPSKEKIPRPKRAYKKVSSSGADHLSSLLEQFLAEQGITISEQEIIRKNNELNLLLKVPSVVGKLTYFCKVKKKAKCDEGDISSAYMEAQIKKLPLLFLYTDELNKKAQEMLATDTFQNAIIKKLER